MIEAGGGACFLLETLAQLRRMNDVRARHLERHVSAELRVACEIDNTETAPAQLTLDLKPAHLRRRRFDWPVCRFGSRELRRIGPDGRVDFKLGADRLGKVGESLDVLVDRW